MTKKAEHTRPPNTSATSEYLVHYVKVVEGSRSSQTVDCLLYRSDK